MKTSTGVQMLLEEAAESITLSTTNAERAAILGFVPLLISRRNLEQAWASRCSVVNIITLAPTLHQQILDTQYSAT